jgi:hypothetical protein
MYTYNYRNISSAGITWINDLQGSSPESAFPEVDPENMDEGDRDKLAAYLRAADGSLSARDLAFSGEVADEIEALEPEAQ